MSKLRGGDNGYVSQGGTVYKYTRYSYPKKKKGEFRKICAPSGPLKKLQRSYLPALYSIFNDEIESLPSLIFHGFLPGKNCVTAASQHCGYGATIQLDVTDFFDSIDGSMLPREIHNLEVPLKTSYGVYAQGFPTSPIIGNIALIRPIESIISRLNMLSIEYAITVYADDIQISTEDDPKMLQEIINIATQEMNRCGFKLNSNKTRIRYAKHGFRRILGINIGGAGEMRATRKTMRKIRAARHQLNHSSLGGLVNWSHCTYPKVKKDNKVVDIPLS